MVAGLRRADRNNANGHCLLEKHHFFRPHLSCFTFWPPSDCPGPCFDVKNLSGSAQRWVNLAILFGHGPQLAIATWVILEPSADKTLRYHAPCIEV